MVEIKEEIKDLILKSYIDGTFHEYYKNRVYSTYYGKSIFYTDTILAILYCKRNNIALNYISDSHGAQDILTPSEDWIVEYFRENFDEKSDFQFVSKLIDFLDNVSHEEFLKIYPDIIEFVFFDAAMRDIFPFSQYLIPQSISDLVFYLMDQIGCHSVYDCSDSMLSLALSLKKGMTYKGQGYYDNLNVYSYIRMQAHGFPDKYYKVIKTEQYFNKTDEADAVFFTYNGKDGYLGAYVLSNIRYAFVLMSKDECRDLDVDSYNKRKNMAHNGLKYVIELPINSLWGNEDETTLIILDKEYEEGNVFFLDMKECKQPEVYKYIGTGDYARKNTYHRIKMEDAITIWETHPSDMNNVITPETLEYGQFIFDYNTYFNPSYGIKNGGDVISFSEVLTLDRGQGTYHSTPEMPNISDELFADNIVDILLNENKPVSTPGTFGVTKRYKGKYLMMSYRGGKMRLFVHNSEGEFKVYERNHWAFRLNDERINPYYLAMAILDTSRGFKFKTIYRHRVKGLTLDDLDYFRRYFFLVPSIACQQQEVEKARNKILARRQAEIDAEKKRLGFKTAASDIAHMLGTTFIHQGSMISYIRSHTPSDERFLDAVKSLVDNVEYTQRMIKYMSEDLDNYAWDTNIREVLISDFIANYISSWNNFGNKCFKTSFENYISEDTVVFAAPDMLAVLMDTLFDNAVRHGFLKQFHEENRVEVSLSNVCYEGEPFVVLSVRNNGKPIEEGFTIEDYISKGRYGEQSGRTGLGGNHVYSIAKGNKGYLYLGRNEDWNVIVDVLIPLKSDNVEMLSEYEYECI